MFYVSRGTGTIYSDTFDKNKGFYPQVEFSVTEQGFLITHLNKGCTTRPADRQLCTMDEVIAQFGLGNQPELATTPQLGTDAPDKKPRKKADKTKPVLSTNNRKKED